MAAATKKMFFLIIKINHARANKNRGITRANNIWKVSLFDYNDQLPRGFAGGV